MVREVLGTEPLEGVLVVDRYNGYNRVPTEIQYCYAHLLREMKDLEQEFESNEEVKNYTLLMKLHLTDAMQLRKRGLPESEYLSEAQAIKLKIAGLSSGKRNIRRFEDGKTSLWKSKTDCMGGAKVPRYRQKIITPKEKFAKSS